MGQSPISGVHTTSVNRPQHQDYPTLIDECIGSFKFLDRLSRDKTNGLTFLSMDRK